MLLYLEKVKLKKRPMRIKFYSLQKEKPNLFQNSKVLKKFKIKQIGY